MSNTVQFHRILCAPADRIYRAFLDPRAKCKWLPPHGFVGEVQHLDARVGEYGRQAAPDRGIFAQRVQIELGARDAEI